MKTDSKTGSAEQESAVATATRVFDHTATTWSDAVGLPMERAQELLDRMKKEYFACDKVSETAEWLLSLSQEEKDEYLLILFKLSTQR